MTGEKQTFTVQQKLHEIEEELKMRFYVYKKRIDEGRMSRETANYKMLVLRSIRDDYREKAALEKQPKLDV